MRTPTPKEFEMTFHRCTCRPQPEVIPEGQMLYQCPECKGAFVGPSMSREITFTHGALIESPLHERLATLEHENQTLRNQLHMAERENLALRDKLIEEMHRPRSPLEGTMTTAKINEVRETPGVGPQMYGYINGIRIWARWEGTGELCSLVGGTMGVCAPLCERNETVEPFAVFGVGATVGDFVALCGKDETVERLAVFGDFSVMVRTDGRDRFFSIDQPTPHKCFVSWSMDRKEWHGQRCDSYEHGKAFLASMSAEIGERHGFAIVIAPD
jgi:hypothetical protein